MTTININGKTFYVEGSLSMINGKWYDGNGCEIDMNNLEGMKEAKTINITIEGNVDRLDVDNCSSIVINGDCKKVKTTSGDIRCNDIDGDAESVSGDIECEVIHGDAKTVNGNIRSAEIRGKASTTAGKANGERTGTNFSGENVDIDGIFGKIFGSVFGSTTQDRTNK